MKVFYGPAISMWRAYIDKILERATKEPIEIADINDADILVEELGDGMKYIYAKPWKYSILFSTEPFHHEPRPYTALFCGNNEMTSNSKEKCVLFPFYWFETKLNKELEVLKPWQGPVPKKFACAFVSNPLNDLRTRVVITLAHLGYLDNYGIIGNNTGGRYAGDPTEKMKEYKFNICFENASHEAYISEKLPNTLKAGIVPVYWGCPNIYKYFNKNRFINVQDDKDSTICEMISLMVVISKEEERWRNIVNQPIFPEEGVALSLESMGDDLANILDGRPAGTR
jgi:hypothetical protein